MSPLQLDDLATHNFPFLTDNIKTKSDFENINLDDLNLECGPLSLDPDNIFLDFHHTEKRKIQNVNPVTQKIKVRQVNKQTQICVRFI